MTAVRTRLPALVDTPIMFAHRGARARRPENTIEAFELARDLGASGLETDVWLSADRQVVLDHDGLHQRIPRRFIADVPRSDLKPHIPTLDQFYRELGGDLPLSVDVKDTEAFEEMLEVARRHGAAGMLWVCHPELSRLVEWRSVAPEIHLVNSTRLGDISEGPERRSADLAAERIDALNLHRTEWTGGLTTLVHRFGVLAFGWDAQYDHHLAALIDIGIDAVYSDHVDVMVDAVASFADHEPR